LHKLLHDMLFNWASLNFVGKRSDANVLADWQRSRQDYWTTKPIDCHSNVHFR